MKNQNNMSDERKQYIAKHKSLFWYTPEDKKSEISDNLLVETILNYGTMDDIRELIKIMGIDNIAHVFFSAKDRMIGNYYPEIYNFFNIVFTRYAQRNS